MKKIKKTIIEDINIYYKYKNNNFDSSLVLSKNKIEISKNKNINKNELYDLKEITEDEKIIITETRNNIFNNISKSIGVHKQNHYLYYYFIINDKFYQIKKSNNKISKNRINKTKLKKTNVIETNKYLYEILCFYNDLINNFFEDIILKRDYININIVYEKDLNRINFAFDSCGNISVADLLYSVEYIKTNLIKAYKSGSKS